MQTFEVSPFWKATDQQSNGDNGQHCTYPVRVDGVLTTWTTLYYPVRADGVLTTWTTLYYPVRVDGVLTTWTTLYYPVRVDGVLTTWTTLAVILVSDCFTSGEFSKSCPSSLWPTVSWSDEDGGVSSPGCFLCQPSLVRASCQRCGKTVVVLQHR